MQETRDAIIRRISEIKEKIAGHEASIAKLEGERHGLRFALEMLAHEENQFGDNLPRTPNEHVAAMAAQLDKPQRLPVQRIVTHILGHSPGPAGMTVEAIVAAAKAADHPSELNPRSVTATLRRLVEQGKVVIASVGPNGEQYRMGGVVNDNDDHRVTVAESPLPEAAC